MKNANMSTKITIAVLAVIVVGGAVLVSNANLLQGNLSAVQLKSGTAKISGMPQGFYNYNGKIVSPVASPVPTVIASPVVSKGGPSLVASALATPVASPVVTNIATMQASQFPKLTKAILNQAAAKDLLKNPSKYSLSVAQKKNLLDAYKAKRVSKSTKLK